MHTANPDPRLAMVEALPALAAHPTLGGEAQTFGRFVGSWELDCLWHAADGSTTQTAGEWHFGWILGGRALQDVLFFYPRGQRPPIVADRRGGTSVRLFDPKSREWHVSWFGATSGFVLHMRGAVAGKRIVLHGIDVDGATLRWSFDDITDTTFNWRGETSSDGGKTWRIEQEMKLRRHAEPGRAS